MKVRMLACLALCSFFASTTIAQAQDSGGGDTPYKISEVEAGDYIAGSCVESDNNSEDVYEAVIDGCDQQCQPCACKTSCKTACVCSDRYLSMYGGWTDYYDFGGRAGIDGLGEAFFDFQTNDGYALGTAIGRRLDNGLRREFEFTYRNNTIGSVTAAVPDLGSIGFDLGGSVNSYAGMYNLYYDITRWQSSRLTPYIGGGIGFAFTDTNVAFDVFGQPVEIDTETSSFAYQGIAGISYKLKSQVELFSEYRVFGIDEEQLAVTLPGLGSGSVDFGGMSHNVFFGARIALR